MFSTRCTLASSPGSRSVGNSSARARATEVIFPPRRSSALKSSMKSVVGRHATSRQLLLLLEDGRGRQPAHPRRARLSALFAGGRASPPGRRDRRASPALGPGGLEPAQAPAGRLVHKAGHRLVPPGGRVTGSSRQPARITFRTCQHDDRHDHLLGRQPAVVAVLLHSVADPFAPGCDQPVPFDDDPLALDQQFVGGRLTGRRSASARRRRQAAACVWQSRTWP